MILKYKGYRAEIEMNFDEVKEEYFFSGRLIGIKDTVAFVASDAQQLHINFCKSVVDYLAFCREEGLAPDSPESANLAGAKEEAEKLRVDLASLDLQWRRGVEDALRVSKSRILELEGRFDSMTKAIADATNFYLDEEERPKKTEL